MKLSPIMPALALATRFRSVRVRDLALFIAPAGILIAAVVAGPALAAGAGPAVFINEFHYDNAGTDAGEFIEVAGPAGTNLSGYAIELYNGSGGAQYDTDALSGTIPNQQNGFGTVTISYPTNGIQNGSPDGIALVNGSTVIQFLSYEGTFTATSGTANGMTSTDIGVDEDPAPAVGLSLQLQGTGTNYGDFTWASPIANTKDSVNTGQTFVAAGPTNPSGIGAASPSALAAGETTLLTVAVTPGSNPTSSGLSVTADLSAIGGSATQNFFDNGTNGDAASGDLTFSFQATVAAATSPGDKTLPVTITDAQLRTGTASISLGVLRLAAIFEIQGNGLASPFAGQKVRTEDNVVTAVFNDGFFIQTPDHDADADAETSNGIFVFTGTTVPTLDVGDQVDVDGTVAEFFDMTEITSPAVRVDFSGVPLPAPFTFDFDTPSPNQPRPATEMERFEGMLVRVENGIATGPTDRFGDVTIAARPGLPFREPGILFPGLPGLPVFDGNPEIFDINTARFSPPAGVPIPRGATVDLAEGPLAFSFSDYQIWPTVLQFTGEAEVVPVRARAAGEFTVASQNLLRLFDDVNDPGINEPVPTTQQYTDRLGKFSMLVRQALGAPDILAVQEAEKLKVLQDLAARIDADGGPSYTPHLLEGNDVGGIDLGFLVRDTVRVDSVVQFGKDDIFEFPDNDPAPLNDRPPLVLDGAYVGNGVPFPIAVIAVHQRSLGGIEDAADGPRVRAKRHEQALRLSQFIQDRQDAQPGVRLVAIGDFNAFEFTDGFVDVMGQVTGGLDPLGALLPGTDEVEPDLTNQTLNMPAEERYSFVFDGSAQSLDHALTSFGMQPFLRGTQHARGNADAPDAFSTNPATSLRSSDHDGTVVFIMSDFDADSVPDDQDVCAGTSIPESVPLARLNPNHFALVDGDGLFDSTVPPGGGAGRSFSIQDTRGCSCEQIVEGLHLGNGHSKHGCSIDVMDQWVGQAAP